MTSRRRVQPLAKAKPLPPAPSRPMPSRSVPKLQQSRPITTQPVRSSATHQQHHKPPPQLQPRVASNSYDIAKPKKVVTTTTTTYTTHVPASSTTLSVNAPRVRYTGGPSDLMSVVRSWAINQDVLDVYMVNAFYTGTNQRKQYPLALWKTATCFGLQAVGVVLLMASTYQSLDTSAQCSGRFNSLSWIAFFFALYISLYCVQSIKSLNQYGMYAWGVNQPKFVNKLWVAVGFWTNFLVLVLSWFCSIIIIYLSTNLSDLVLNSLALLFLISLDDEIIGSYDYETIGRWIDQEYTGWAPHSCVDCVCDKLGDVLFKILILWEKRVTFAIAGVNNNNWLCRQFHDVLLLDLLIYPWLFLLPFIIIMCHGYDVMYAELDTDTTVV